MAPVLLVATILTAIIIILCSMVGLGRWGGDIPGRYWARLFCFMTMVRVTVIGRENINPHTSYVFVCNHQGAYDIFSIYGYLNHSFRWMMKVSLGKIPLVGAACRMCGHIMVDNSTRTATRHTMEHAERQLQGGTSLVVFPEGARTWDGKMRPFKRGAYMLAVEFGLPVVPVTIDGAYNVMPRTSKIPKWGHITLTIHKPIPASADGKHDLPTLMETSWSEIHASLPKNLQ